MSDEFVTLRWCKVCSHGEGGTYVEGWMPNTPDRRQSEDK